MYKLFIDDERFPVTEDWVIVRTSVEAISYMKDHGFPSMISFDHDLGGDDTSRPVVRWIGDQVVSEGVQLPADFNFYVHSQNPVGRDWINGTMNRIVELARGSE